MNGAVVGDSQRAAFGYVAERVALYWHRTVKENAQLFARLKGHSNAAAFEQLKRLGLDSMADRPTHQLSKGMLQRLGLAIGLCGQPELLVLDEPFNGLDPALLDIFQTVLAEEKRRGATLLISTHTISAVEPLATHVAILTDGQLAASGSVQNLRTAHPEESSLEGIYRRVARRPQVVEELAP
jgi:ABC-type multidrug transport system ATPase subunit